MCPTVLHSPGPHESIPPNRFSKFEREHAFRSIFRFWSIYSPIRAKLEICSEKRVPVRISRNGLAESIREDLENATPLGA